MKKTWLVALVIVVMSTVALGEEATSDKHKSTDKEAATVVPIKKDSDKKDESKSTSLSEKIVELIDACNPSRDTAKTDAPVPTK